MLFAAFFVGVIWSLISFDHTKYTKRTTYDEYTDIIKISADLEDFLQGRYDTITYDYVMKNIIFVNGIDTDLNITKRCVEEIFDCNEWFEISINNDKGALYLGYITNKIYSMFYRSHKTHILFYLIKDLKETS